MSIENKIQELNKYLRRAYVISFDNYTKILTIHNEIHVYELFKIRVFIFRNSWKVKEIRVEG